jgi:3-oxoacyl-[acyl-carrier protein] reductase
MSEPTGGRRFLDQAVIVTGGSRGIGRAIAIGFAREGADVVLNYAGNHEAAASAAEAIRAHGRTCLLVPGSVADPQTAVRLAATALDALGHIDVLVNNAGITRDGNLMMLRDSAWQEILGVNVSGSFYCCRAVFEPMRRQGKGVILNMTSTAGIKGRSGQVAYATTKGAVIALTKSLAQEFGPYGILVNAIAPGFVETDMVASVLARAGAREAFLEATPLHRFGKPEDVADAALFLASSDSSFVNGHILLVNGGLYV